MRYHAGSVELEIRNAVENLDSVHRMRTHADTQARWNAGCNVGKASACASMYWAMCSTTAHRVDVGSSFLRTLSMYSDV